MAVLFLPVQLTIENGNTITNPQSRIRYQISDHLGSSSIELSETGQIISFEEYYPFGGTSYHSTSSQSQVSQKRYRYNGKEKDEETNLYYYGARYYISWLGRWMSADPMGEVDGLNLYVYSQNNPINLIDPTGNASTSPEGSEQCRATENMSSEERKKYVDDYSKGSKENLKSVKEGFKEGITGIIDFVKGTYKLFMDHDTFAKAMDTVGQIMNLAKNDPAKLLEIAKETLGGEVKDFTDNPNKYSGEVLGNMLAGFFLGKLLHSGMKGLEKFTGKVENLSKTSSSAMENTVKWNRLNTVGKTPGKNSATGRKVIDRMTKDEKIKDDPILGKMFQDSSGEWRELKYGDMSHKEDAVKWWNSTGRYFGAKSQEVRKWMLNHDNYVIDYYKINRSSGAKLKDRYLPPTK